MIIDDFRQLYFGEASNEAEIRRDEQHFYDTYLDIWDLKSKFLNNSFFLILGPKGAGKTAVGQYLRMSLERAHGPAQTFWASMNLDDVTPNVSSLSSITSKLVSPNATGITKSSWKLYLALEYLRLVSQDNGSSLATEPQFMQLQRDLEKAELVGADYPRVLRTVRENKLSFNLKIVKGATKTSRQVRIDTLGQEMLDLMFKSESSGHYLLILDGLDRIINDNPAYWLSLASLLNAGMDIHDQSARCNLNFHLLVMCRSDVFRKVAFADADKIPDVSLFVDWATYQTDVRASPLWDYIAKKSGVGVQDLFDTLPATVEVGKRSKSAGHRSIETITYLLNSTRSTPREMTLLMKRLQEVVPQRGKILGDQVRQAVDLFASRDLLTILSAEASGVLDQDMRQLMSAVLSSLPRARQVTRAEFAEAMQSNDLDPLKVTDFTQFLFLAGVLGNSANDGSYVQFYHRRDTYAFRSSGPWALHRGLMYALNIPY